VTPRPTPEPAAPDPRGVVLDVLVRVVVEGAHASAALDRALAALPRAEDRAFATDVVYGTLRWLPALDAALSARLRDPDALPPRVRAALRAGAFERTVRGTPAHAAVHAWVEAIKRGGGPERALAALVNAVLRRVDLADAARLGGPAAAVALPPALWHHLEAALGTEAAATAARAMLAPAPLWLTALADGAVRALEAEGAEVRTGPLPTSWSVRPRRPLAALSAFRDGLVQPQNPSSAAVVAALGDVRGQRVLDVGSGHGVKAAQLAAAGADVIAVELDARRAEVGRRNLGRLGYTVRHVVADATEALDAVPLVDAALLDAPCTGTGTLRGHPEIKLRWSAADLDRARQRQAAMLRQVAARVRPGGRLLYAVCALGREEGEGVVADFLSGAADWRALPVDLPLPSHPAAVGVRILPSPEGLDGFYVALLARAADPGGPGATA
jgi:16S rRNA (cytosine967-C5)-methyltransferase